MRPLRTPVGLLFCRSQTSVSLLAYGRILCEVDVLAQATLAVACLQGVFTPFPTFPVKGEEVSQGSPTGSKRPGMGNR